MKGIRAIMLGLDEGGKTVILYQLKLGETVTTIPTIGFNVETIQHKDAEFTMWDVGGQDRIRVLWKHYLKDTQALIFVVDATKRDRFPEAQSALQQTLADGELAQAVLLVYANKQDLMSAASPAEVTEALGLHKLTARKWAIFGCSATNGDGLKSGLDWLVLNSPFTPIEAKPPAQPEPAPAPAPASEEDKSKAEADRRKLESMIAKLEAITKIVYGCPSTGSLYIQELKKVLVAQPGDTIKVDGDGTVHVFTSSP